MNTFFSMASPHGRLIRRGTVAATALLSAGCFRYVPAEPGAIEPGRDARLELTRPGFARLPEIPNHSGPDLSGTVVRREGEQLWLRVPVNIRENGLVVGTVDQDVVIPTSDIAVIERREFSRKRTAMVGLGGLGVLVGIASAFGDSGPPIGGDQVKPIDEEAGALASFPLFSIFF
jgi:hypothetical protein